MKTMKALRNTITGLCLLGSALAYSQTDKNVESTIKDITVFLSSAQVTRDIKTKVEAGKTNLIISGLSAQLDANSIQVSGTGSFMILGTNHRQNFLQDVNLPKPLKVLRDSMEYYQRILTLEQNQKEILNKEESMLMANQKIGGSNQNITVAELKAMADFYRIRLGDIASTRIKQDMSIRKLNEKITRLQAQINAQTELRARNSSEIVVSISADVATSVAMEVKYIVTRAGWHPVYDLRVENTKSPVKLGYKASVFQSTGEEWKNVKLTLSTTNPNLSGSKPELSAQYIDILQPMVAYRDKVYMKKADVSATGSEELFKGPAGEASSLADMVLTTQTAINTQFSINLPYTVESSNKPTLVEIGNHEVVASYQYSVAPKLDADAFLLAKASGWADLNLLPGEANVFFEGTFVGKTFVDPASVNDTLSLSLGRDKRIVVKREKVKDFTSRKAIGANIRETYAYEVSVRNNRLEPVTIVVEDQVPVSQNSQIEVSVADTGGSSWNKETGKLTWLWTVAPSDTRKATFRFEVKYPKDKQVSGL